MFYTLLYLKVNDLMYILPFSHVKTDSWKLPYKAISVSYICTVGKIIQLTFKVIYLIYLLLQPDTHTHISLFPPYLQALLRPGRLDRVVYVPLPDTQTRTEIFSIQFRKMPIAEDVSIEDLVGHTEKYSGAEVHDLLTQKFWFAAVML